MTEWWKDQFEASDGAIALRSIIDMARADLPFVAQVAAFASDAATIDEFEVVLTSVYRLALEHGHPFIPDLADGLLRWVEETTSVAN